VSILVFQIKEQLWKSLLPPWPKPELFISFETSKILTAPQWGGGKHKNL